MSNFSKKFSVKVFLENFLLKFQVLKKIGKNIIKYGHLKEQKILSKMRGCSALHDVSLQSYKHKKNRKKCVFSQFYQKTQKNQRKTVFFGFSNAYNFTTKHRGELGNPSFCSEFFALSDDYI